MFRTNKINKLLSTGVFILTFIGFQFFTSLLLPTSIQVEGIERSVTTPYRALSIMLIFLMIIFNVRSRTSTNRLLNVFIFFWILFFFRLFYDLNIRTDIYIQNSYKIWLYAFGITFPSILAIYLSFNNIDIEKAFKWIFWLTAFTIIMSFISNRQLVQIPTDYVGRLDGNLAMNPISYGHLGTTGFLLSLFFLFSKKTTIVLKLIILVILAVSILTIILSGSRGPIIAAIIAIIFWIFAFGKNVVTGILLALVFIILIVLNSDLLINLIGNYSPVMQDRLNLFINESNFSGRDILFSQSYDAFQQNPIFGTQFAIFESGGNFRYSHNIILDALMGMGLIGGILIAYTIVYSIIQSYILIKRRDKQYWISLILIQYIVYNMVSSTIYYNVLLSVLITYSSIYFKKSKHENTLSNRRLYSYSSTSQSL